MLFVYLITFIGLLQRAKEENIIGYTHTEPDVLEGWREKQQLLTQTSLRIEKNKFIRILTENFNCSTPKSIQP